MFERRRFENLPYGLWNPAPGAGDRPPLILFLHGIGESGADGVRPLRSALPRIVERDPESWPFVVVAPQKPRSVDEWEEHAPALFNLLDALIEELGVDSNRVHVTGLSQGGHGAWMLGQLAPERWATVVPICGYVTPPTGGWLELDPDSAWKHPGEARACAELAHALARTQVWTFHGEADRVVPSALTVRAVEALRAAHAPVRSTLYPGVDHACWDRAYSDPDLARFLLETRR